MTLRPYSARPGRLAVQVLTDLFVVLWVYAWIAVGRFVHDSILEVAGVGYGVQTRAGGVAGNLREAGDNASGVPLVGDTLGSPLRDAADQVGQIADAGRDAGDRIAALATPAAFLVAAGPVLVVVLAWLFVRLRFARRAGAAAQLAAAPAGEDLLALRALAGRPLHQLTAITPDPVEAWRRGDPDAVRALAALELHGAGVRARRPRAIGPVPGTGAYRAD